MIRFFLKIFDTLRPHRRAVGLVTFAVLLLCGIFASRMHYEEDISAFMPLDEQSARYSEVFNKMGGQDKIAVLFSVGGQDDGVEALEGAMDAFGEAVARRDVRHEVRHLQVRVDESALAGVLGEIGMTYPLYLTEGDYRHLDSLLADSGYVREQMERNKLMLMLPMGGLMSQNMPYDPLHLSSGVMGRLRDLNVGGDYQVVDGYLFKDSTGVVLLESPYGISESRNNKQLGEMLDSCMADVRADYPLVSVSAVGAPLIAVTNATQIKADSILAVGLSVALILLILLYSFRRVGDLAWVAVSVFAGWLFALGTIALLRDGISLIVIGIGSVIIGIAVNYPLHFVGHLKEETDMRELLKEMVPPLLVGNITTVSAFLCLVLLDARAMQDLGLFGSLTLIGTILFVLVCLPVFVRLHKRVVPDRPLMPWRCLGITQDKRVRQLVFWMVAGLTCVFGYLSTGTSFDSNMQNINYMLPQQREDLKFLSSSVQGQGDSLQLLYAVSEGRTLDEALQRNEALASLLSGMEGVHRVTGVSGLMLSDSLCRQRLFQWTAFWGRHEDVLPAFRRAAFQAGFSEEAFRPFEDMAFRPSSFPDSLRAQGREIVSSLIGRHFVMQGDSLYKVINFVQIDKRHAERIKTRLSASLPAESYVFLQSDVSNHLAEKLSEAFDFVGVVCGVVVFAFLWLSFGCIELSLMAFLPLAVGWIWILGIMQLLGMQFNIVNIILATFIFGQGDDYTIFITEGLMYEYTTGKRRLQKYKESVALSAVIMFVGIGTLIFSKHPAMRSLAEVAIIGMVTVVFMAYYIPPLVFRWLTQRNGKRREYPVTLSRLAYSLFSITFFLFGMFFLLIPYTCLVHRPLRKIWNGERFYHQLLQRISRFVIRHVPGVRFREENVAGESFARPAVIVCNHQSHLDLMCIMQLSPKIVVLTNDWVWNNPYYGAVIHAAEFYPVSNGYDQNFPHLQRLVERGYSIVVFPEGTRTKDGEIGRFHKGAFSLAQALGVDILPLCIHGLYDVLPKHDFMLRRGSVTLEICKRIPFDAIKDVPAREVTRRAHGWFVEHYAALRQRLETPAYWAPYVAYANKYKVSV